MAEAPGRRGGGSSSRPKVRTAPKRKPASARPSATTARPRTPDLDVAADDALVPDRGGNGWLELVTTLVQAPVGMGRAQAERLVGELVKSQGRAQSAADGFDRFIENRIEDVLNRLNIPSRSDIDRLHRSVDLLTAKVEALLSQHERSAH